MNTPFYLSENRGETSVDVNGTHLIGTVITTFDKLKEAFGTPFSGCDKTTAEWAIELPKIKAVATIYDWKTEETPMGEYEWHVGSHNKNPEVIRMIEKILAD